jgi:hypothetical protein
MEHAATDPAPGSGHYKHHEKPQRGRGARPARHQPRRIARTTRGIERIGSGSGVSGAHLDGSAPRFGAEGALREVTPLNPRSAEVGKVGVGLWGWSEEREEGVCVYRQQQGQSINLAGLKYAPVTGPGRARA